MSLHSKAGWRLAEMEALMHVRDALDGVIAYRQRSGFPWSDDLCVNAVAAARGAHSADVRNEVLAFQLDVLRAERAELQRRIDELLEDLPGMLADVARSFRPPLSRHITRV